MKSLIALSLICSTTLPSFAASVSCKVIGTNHVAKFDKMDNDIFKFKGKLFVLAIAPTSFNGPITSNLKISLQRTATDTASFVLLRAGQRSVLFGTNEILSDEQEIDVAVECIRTN